MFAGLFLVAATYKHVVYTRGRPFHNITESKVSIEESWANNDSDWLSRLLNSISVACWLWLMHHVSITANMRPQCHWSDGGRNFNALVLFRLPRWSGQWQGTKASIFFPLPDGISRIYFNFAPLSNRNSVPFALWMKRCFHHLIYLFLVTKLQEKY